jgi:hypothetical protein
MMSFSKKFVPLPGWVMIALAIGLMASCSFGSLMFDDGSTGNELASDANGSLYVSGGTSLKLVTGGSADSAYLLDDSFLEVEDGAIVDLKTYDTSVVEMYGGSIANLYCNMDSEVHVYGGDIDGVMDVSCAGTVIIYAGGPSSIEQGALEDLSGSINVQLTDGNFLSVDYEKSPDATIMIVPEPASMLLVGAGALLLRRKRL